MHHLKINWAFNPSSHPATDDQHLRQRKTPPTAEPSASVDKGKETSPAPLNTSSALFFDFLFIQQRPQKLCLRLLKRVFRLLDGIHFRFSAQDDENASICLVR